VSRCDDVVRVEGQSPAGNKETAGGRTLGGSRKRSLVLVDGTRCLKQNPLKNAMKRLKVREGDLVRVWNGLEQAVKLSEQRALAGGQHLLFQFLDFLLDTEHEKIKNVQQSFIRT